MKRVLSLFLVVLLLVSLIACDSNETNSSDSNESVTNESSSVGSASNSESSADNGVTDGSQSSDDEGYVDEGEMKIRLFKVGKSDASLIRTKDYVILIDSSSDDHGQEILDYLAEKSITSIDYMIITHFDKSEVGGADIILKGTEVKTVVQPAYTKDSTQAREYVAALGTVDSEVVTLKEEMTINCNDVELTLYPAQKSYYAEDDDNNFSIAVNIIHGDNSFLFAGDAMSARMKELVEFNQAKGLEAFSFVKMPCNGVYCEGTYGISTTEFIEAVDPIYASISCSEKNPAEAAVVDALAAVGTKVFFTKDGNIKITSDGEMIEIVQ